MEHLHILYPMRMGGSEGRPVDGTAVWKDRGVEWPYTKIERASFIDPSQ